MDMSGIDVIELQLLQIIIPAGSRGRNYAFPDLYQELIRSNKRLREMAMHLGEDEVIAAFLSLLKSDCITIRHYTAGETVDRIGSERLDLFHLGTLTSTRVSPGAFKRRDVLVGKNKRGIFISHKVSEARLQSHCKDSCAWRWGLTIRYLCPLISGAFRAESHGLQKSSMHCRPPAQNLCWSAMLP
jgi:hypothetical protein